MTKPMTVDELFDEAGGGAKIHFNKHSQPGDSVEGNIVHLAAQQARGYDDNALLWWDEEKTQAKKQLVVTLQTRLRDRSIEDDDGLRRVFLRWWGTDRANTLNAVVKSGDGKVRIGGWMKVTFTGYGEAVGRLNPPKIFAVEYRKAPTEVDTMTTPPEAVVPERAATVTQIPRQAEAQPMLPEPEAEPSGGDAITEAARVQAERRAQIMKVKKLRDGGFSLTEIEEIVTGLDRKAITAILEI
jgi:hypothetical protein